VVLVKGHETVITDGRLLAYNTTGNPGMATGGCGDVLTGVITAFLCQGLSPFDAARLAAHVHGKAGDLVAAEIGMVGMIARDLLRRIPRAIRVSTDSEVPF
jgi:NAD(P)H-hydrate epimerase